MITRYFMYLTVLPQDKAPPFTLATSFECFHPVLYNQFF